MTYEIVCSVDVGKSIEPIGSLLNNLNQSLVDSGVNDKVKMVSNFKFGELTVSRELTPKEIEDIKTIIQAGFIKNRILHKYDIRINSIQLKGGE